MALRGLRGLRALMWGLRALMALRGRMGASIINYNKMKLFRISLISLLVVCTAFFSSCIAEGEHYCPVGGFHLFFEYLENEEDSRDPATVFNAHIDVVDVFIFDDATGAYVTSYRRTREQLQMARSFGGTRTTRLGIDLSDSGLEPGNTYRIVAWGNTHAQRAPWNQQGGVDNALNATYYGRLPDGSVGNPLHFGPGSMIEDATQAFTITIPTSIREEYAVLEFSRAHTTVEVFVVGADFVPGVEITDVASGINFNNEHLPGARLSFNDTATRTGFTPEANPRLALISTFHTPLFDYDTDKYIVISDAGTPLVNGAINLSDELAGTALELRDTNFARMVVPVIVVVVDDVVVEVIIPVWIQEPWEPEL